MIAGQRYPSVLRLRRRDEFGLLLRRQQKAVGANVVLLVAPRARGEARLGVMISKRVDKRAVRRHQLKRWVVELFRRELRPALPPLDLLVLFRRDPAGKDAHERLDREIRGLIDKAIAASALWSRGRRKRRRR